MSEKIDREEIAVEALTLIEVKGLSARIAMNRVAQEMKITDWKERGAAHALVFEVLRRRNTLDKILNMILRDGSPRLMHPYLRNLLRLAIYQMKFGKTNSALVTNEAVKITKEKFGVKAAKFVNAILRQAENLPLQKIYENLNDTETLSIRYFYPTWLIKYLTKLVGRHTAIKIMKKTNTVPPIYLRINTLKGEKEEILKMLKREGIEIKEDKDLPDVAKVVSYEKPVTRTKAFQEGYIYMQTKSSALVSHVLDPKPGEFVIDLCAAPGGKTTHIAQLMRNCGKILAIDLNARRVKEMKEKFKKLEVKIAHPLVADSRTLYKATTHKADRVLVDVPCSSTGAIWSKPEIKWKTKPRDIKHITQIQWGLLTAAAKLVKTGGVLVYSTCSITLEENELLIEKFLKLNPEFKLVPAEPFIGFKAYRGLEDAQRLFPYPNETEGFFIAKMKKCS